MKNKKQWYQLVAALAILAVTGCSAGARAVSETQIRDLEREVARLRSERANLDARAAALDDQVVLLKSRLKKCTAPSQDTAGRSLEIVKLTPDDEEETDIYEAEIVEEDANTSKNRRRTAGSKEKRPVLVLDASRTSSSTAPIPRRVDEKLSIPADFHRLGADNLGVTGGGGAGGASRIDDMDAFNEAYRAYSNKRPEAALSGFAAFLKTHPDHDFSDDAVYWRGECYLGQGKFLHAIGEFERLVHRYPTSEKVPSALYRIGFAYDKLRDLSKAYEYYFKVVEKFPGTDAARRAGSRVAEIKNNAPVGEPLLPTSAAR